MLIPGEVRQRIGDEERLDVTHKGVGGGGHAADMGVHPGDDQLIAAALFEHLLQRRAVKRAVAPLHQHGVCFVRGQFSDNALLLRGTGQARSPHVIQQGAVFIALLLRLGGVIDRDPLLFAVVAQAGNVRHYLGHHRAVIAPKVQEVFLHIVDQQRGARGLHRPADFVGRQICCPWQRITG